MGAFGSMNPWRRAVAAELKKRPQVVRVQNPNGVPAQTARGWPADGVG